MEKLKTIGNTTTTNTSFFRNAICLNEANLAHETLKKVLGDNYYPNNATSEWTDILVLDNEYYACFGEDSLTTDTQIVYIQVEPTESLIKSYEYFSQF